jgi:hypothetical protein
MKDRYSVRFFTDEVKTNEGYVRVRHVGWWLYDWETNKTVHVFKTTEEEQAKGMCKLLNSIEEENDGLSK